MSTSDTQVGTEAVAAIAASDSISAGSEVNGPSDPGTYYYGACVDAVTGESDTTNNCSTSVQVDVSESDPDPEPDPEPEPEPEPVPALPLLGQLLLALGLATAGARLTHRHQRQQTARSTAVGSGATRLERRVPQPGLLVSWCPPITLLKRAETPTLREVNVLPTAALRVLPDVQRTHRTAAPDDE